MLLLGLIDVPLWLILLIAIVAAYLWYVDLSMQWSKWGGGGVRGGLPPPPNVQESVQILEIWKQMCKF